MYTTFNATATPAARSAVAMTPLFAAAAAATTTTTPPWPDWTTGLDWSAHHNRKLVEDLGDDTPRPHVLPLGLLDTPLQLWNHRTRRVLSCAGRAPWDAVATGPRDDASGRQRWVLHPAPGACGEYVVRATASARDAQPAEAYLSAHYEEPTVAIWGVDDASGRQRWRLQHDSGDRYYVWVAGGRTDDMLFLTAVGGDGVGLARFDAGNRRQLWRLTSVVAPPAAPPAAMTTSATRIPGESSSLLLKTIGLSYAQVDTILQLVSLPENGHPEWWKNYGYAEFLGDGRGYTAGIFGACSGTGDLALVLDQVANIDPAHPLARFADAVRRKRGDDVAGIERVKDLILGAGADPVWQRAVWRVYVDLYWKFAARFADKQGDCAGRPGPKLPLAISRGFVLDTAINHGADLSSFQHILKRMPAPEERDELKWLQSFIDTRERLLRSGFQTLDTSKTGDRCRLWSRLLQSGNYALSRPLQAYEGYWGAHTLR